MGRAGHTPSPSGARPCKSDNSPRPRRGNRNAQEMSQVASRSGRGPSRSHRPTLPAHDLQLYLLARCRPRPCDVEGGQPLPIGPAPGSPSMSFQRRVGFRRFCMVYIGERQSSGANGRAAVPGEADRADPSPSEAAPGRCTGWLVRGTVPETARPTRSEVGPGSVVNPAREEGDPFR